MSSEMSKLEKEFPKKRLEIGKKTEEVSIKEQLKKELDTRRELVRKGLGDWAGEISKFTSDPNDEWTSFVARVRINTIKTGIGAKGDLRETIGKLPSGELKKILNGKI